MYICIVSTTAKFFSELTFCCILRSVHHITHVKAPHFPPTSSIYPDQFQISWLFQVVQLGGHPALNAHQQTKRRLQPEKATTCNSCSLLLPLVWKTHAVNLYQSIIAICAQNMHYRYSPYFWANSSVASLLLNPQQSMMYCSKTAAASPTWPETVKLSCPYHTDKCAPFINFQTVAQRQNIVPVSTHQYM